MIIILFIFKLHFLIWICFGGILDRTINLFSKNELIFVYVVKYCYYYYYGSTNVWMPRVKNKSFGWSANRKQPQHWLKFVIIIIIIISIISIIIIIIQFIVNNCRNTLELEFIGFFIWTNESRLMIIDTNKSIF